jgi:hypothetical protein
VGNSALRVTLMRVLEKLSKKFGVSPAVFF